jgi:hypothetical protein
MASGQSSLAIIIHLVDLVVVEVRTFEGTRTVTGVVSGDRRYLLSGQTIAAGCGMSVA